MNRFRPHYDPMDGPLTPEEAAGEWDTGVYEDEDGNLRNEDGELVDNEPDYEQMLSDRNEF